MRDHPHKPITLDDAGVASGMDFDAMISAHVELEGCASTMGDPFVSPFDPSEVGAGSLGVECEGEGSGSEGGA